MRENFSLSSLHLMVGADARALAYMLRDVYLLCHRVWDIGHPQILMFLAESDQDKMIPMISFEGPVMQMFDISLAYDPAV
jgi:hypothetical protein